MCGEEDAAAIQAIAIFANGTSLRAARCAAGGCGAFGSAGLNLRLQTSEQSNPCWLAADGLGSGAANRCGCGLTTNGCRCGFAANRLGRRCWLAANRCGRGLTANGFRRWFAADRLRLGAACGCRLAATFFLEQTEQAGVGLRGDRDASNTHHQERQTRTNHLFRLQIEIGLTKSPKRANWAKSKVRNACVNWAAYSGCLRLILTFERAFCRNKVPELTLPVS